jgi:hypothetical protein
LCVWGSALGRKATPILAVKSGGTDEADCSTSTVASFSYARGSIDVR